MESKKLSVPSSETLPTVDATLLSACRIQLVCTRTTHTIIASTNVANYQHGYQSWNNTVLDRLDVANRRERANPWYDHVDDGDANRITQVSTIVYNTILDAYIHTQPSKFFTTPTQSPFQSRFPQQSDPFSLPLPRFVVVEKRNRRELPFGS